MAFQRIDYYGTNIRKNIFHHFFEYQKKPAKIRPWRGLMEHKVYVEIC